MIFYQYYFGALLFPSRAIYSPFTHLLLFRSFHLLKVDFRSLLPQFTKCRFSLIGIAFDCNYAFVAQHLEMINGNQRSNVLTCKKREDNGTWFHEKIAANEERGPLEKLSELSG